MKFLLDENCKIRAKDLNLTLRDSIDIADTSTDDDCIIENAKEQNSIIVTIDMQLIIKCLKQNIACAIFDSGYAYIVGQRERIDLLNSETRDKVKRGRKWRKVP